MEAVSRPVPAPPDLGVEVIGVPEGDEIELDLRLESVVEGVLVSGEVHVLAVGECARCLEPLERALDVDIQELYVYPGHEHEMEDEGRTVVEDGLVDLEPAIRDAVVLALPLAPLCSPGCTGLCVECGVRLADVPGHEHDEVDPRWAALAALTGTNGTDDRTTENGTTENGTTGTRTIGDRTRTDENEEN